MTSVLHVLPHSGGGGERYIDLIERIPGFKHERFFLSAGRSPRDGLQSIPPRLPLLIVRARGAGLVHVHGDAAALLAIPAMAQRPAILTTHGLHLQRRSSGTQKRIVNAGLRAAVAAARAVICTSQAENAELSEVMRPRDAPKVRVIMNGVDPPAPLASGTREAVRADLGAGPTTVLGLFAGQLEARKRPLLAAEAAAGARAHGFDFRLAVAGTGPLAGELAQWAGDAVIPLGFRDDLPAVLEAADIFLQPSEREGLSLALLEAMARGLAIVAADGPGNPEALGAAGLLVATGDVNAFADAISRLCSDSGLRSELGQHARVRARTEFSVQRFLDATAAVYRQVLTGQTG